MSSSAGEIRVERVEKIDTGNKMITTPTASVHGAATGAVAELRGIDKAAAEYIVKVHRRIAAEEAAADAKDASK